MKKYRSRKKINVLITAGPTREYLDPVRFISNASSGRTGYEIAACAAAGGAAAAAVTLISGHVCIKPPEKVKVVYVETSRQMKSAVNRFIRKADIFISAAAVSDWRPARYSKKKIKKAAGALVLKLIKNPDILKETASRFGRKRLFAGFALETGDIIKNARKKLRDKKLDLIIANSPANISSQKAAGIIICKDGRVTKIPAAAKNRFARIIWKEIQRVYEGKQKRNPE